MNIKKPNSFARYGNDYVAPLTTIDQIVKPSGERYTNREFELMSNVENVMFGENSAGKNLLNPTLQTTTQNGVTCTNNGDGTFTLNGTASATTVFYLYEDVMPNTKTLNLCGCPKNNGGIRLKVDQKISPYTSYGNDTGNGSIMNIEDASSCYIGIDSGTICNNLVFKPMITDDLSATYDDFEPYVKSLKQLTNSALNMDLLWTNASPTSGFANQTISLDFTNYKMLYFEFLRQNNNQDDLFSYILLSNKSYYCMQFNNVFMARQVTIGNNEIIFADCLNFVSYNGTNIASNNNFSIPHRIFGIK